MKKYLLQILFITILTFLTGLTPVKSNCMAFGATLRPDDWEVTIYVRVQNGFLPAAGALVTMTSDKGNGDNIYSGVAGPDGRIIFANVGEGIYSLDITLDYFQPYHEENMQIFDNRIKDVDLIEACLPPSSVHVNTTQAVLCWLPPVPEPGKTIAGRFDNINNGDPIRYLSGYNVLLNGEFQGFTTELNYTLVDLVMGDEYIASVQAVYPQCVSDTISCSFIYYPCEYFNQPMGLKATLVGKEVNITWESGIFYFGEYLVKYDNDMPDTVRTWEVPGGETAVKFTPEGYPCILYAFHMYIGDGSWPPGNILSTFRIIVYDDDGQDGNPGTVLGQKDVMPDHYGWIDVDLQDLDVVFVNGNFYLSHYQLGYFPDCPPTGVDGSAAGQGRSFDHQPQTAWVPGLFDQYMIRATLYGVYFKDKTQEKIISYGNDYLNTKTESINPPAFNLIGFNVYKNDIKLNDEPLTEEGYTDYPSPGGVYYYNVTDVWDMGESCPIVPSEEIVYGEDYAAPEDLTAVGDEEHNVLLTWNVPGTTTGEWIHWDNGTNYTGIGLTFPGSFFVASRWTPDDLAAYDSMNLTRVAFFPTGSVTQYALKVWEGENASVLIVDQPISGVISGQWDIVVLETPVPIDISKELWFGYECIDQPQGEYPAGCDAGPAVAGKGDMISEDGVTWETLSGYGLDYNWNLQGWVTKSSDDRAILIGYNLWCEDTNFQFVPVPDTSYTNTYVLPGTYNYYISAIYDDAESFLDGPATVTIPASGNLNGLVYDGITLDPVTQATVTLNPGGYTVQTTGDGKYYLTQIPWGGYALTVMHAGYSMASTNVVIDSVSQVTDVALFSSDLLQPLPFYESWGQASFNTHYWWFDPSPGNWTIGLQIGNLKPSAEFSWLPERDSYSYALESPNIDATEASQHVVLEFDLFLDTYNSTGQEYLTTDVWDGSEWANVAVFENDTDIYWAHYVYDITGPAYGRVTQIRFIANGSNSFNINGWGIDNISVHEQEAFTLDGTVTDADNGNPIEGAMVSIPGYDPVYTDNTGFYTIDVIEGTYDITYSAEWYLPRTDTGITITGTTHHDVALLPNLCYPPQNLTYEIVNGDVYLYWDPPVNIDGIKLSSFLPGIKGVDGQRIDNLSLIGYNIYRNGEKINTYPVTGNQYTDENPGIGLYIYCVSALYTLCESDTICTEVLITGMEEFMNGTNRVFPVPAGDFINVGAANDIRELKIINYTGQVIYEQQVGEEKKFRIGTSGFRTGSYLIEFISEDGSVITKKIVIVK